MGWDCARRGRWTVLWDCDTTGVGLESHLLPSRCCTLWHYTDKTLGLQEFYGFEYCGVRLLSRDTQAPGKIISQGHGHAIRG